MQCGTFPAWAAQAGIRLPPTLEADMSEPTNSNRSTMLAHADSPEPAFSKARLVKSIKG